MNIFRSQLPAPRWSLPPWAYWGVTVLTKQITTVTEDVIFNRPLHMLYRNRDHTDAGVKIETYAQTLEAPASLQNSGANKCL